MNASCPYAVLGLSYDATDRDVRQAYVRAIERFRAGVGNADHLVVLRQAYKVLSDTDARRQYDTDRLVDSVVAGRLAIADAADRHELSFGGSGKVYFGIWITNLLLSFLTLGIYSAWAKVRREQYFHRQLQLDGAGFDYHGAPLAILRGRIVFFLILGACSLTPFLPPAIRLLVGVGVLLLLPWMIVRSLQFRAANTSYRGLRFSFRGRYREALAVYLGYGLLTVLSLGLALPLMMWRQKKFVISQLGYGANPFGFYATRGMFYRALWLPTLFLFALFAVLPAAALIYLGKSALFVVLGLMATKVLLPVLVVVALVAQLLVLPYARMAALNVAWSNTRLNDVRLVCRQRFASCAATHLSNWLLLILSLGLFWPWAQVRTVAYRARHFAVDAPAGLGEFVAGRLHGASALGGEAAAALDMDVDW